MEEKKHKNESLSYYVKLTYRWRKFLVIHLLTIAIISIIIALIIPKTFTSSATVLPEGGFNIASAILPSHMTEGLGSAIGSLTGDSGAETNKIMSILKSRELAVNVINEFDLMSKFEAATLEDAIENFRDMVFVTIDDELMIRISVHAKSNFFNFKEDTDKTRQFAYNVAEFVTSELDRRFTNLSVEKATFERVLVEERFQQNQRDLQHAEEALRDFSLENSLIALPQQIEAAVETAAYLEAQIIADQIQLGAMTQSLGSSRPEVRQKQIAIEQAENRLNEIKLFGSSADSLRLFPSFQAAPDLVMQFVQLEREREVQTILYEFLIQQYEQLKIQEARQSPSLQYIDQPAIPTKRTSPTRSILVILLCLIGGVAGIGYIITYELYQDKYKNLIADTIRDAKSE